MDDLLRQNTHKYEEDENVYDNEGPQPTSGFIKWAPQVGSLPGIVWREQVGVGEAHVGAGCAAAAYDDAPGVHDAGRRGGVFNGGPVRAFEENCPDAFRGWSGEKFGLSGSCFGPMQPCSDLTFGESSVAENRVGGFFRELAGLFSSAKKLAPEKTTEF